MLPITRATVNNFCRVCLQLVGESGDQNGLQHDINDDPQILRILHEMADNDKQSNSDIAEQLCHSCFTKITMFRKFAEVSICSSVAISELMNKQHELSNNKLNLICATCFKRMSGSINTTNLLSASELQNLLRVIFIGIDKREIFYENIEPNKLCGGCYQKCRTFVEFQKQIQDSYQYLKSILLNDISITDRLIIINEQKDHIKPPDKDANQDDSEPEIDNIMSKTTSDNADPIELCDLSPKTSISCNANYEDSKVFCRCIICNRTFRKLSSYQTHKCTEEDMDKSSRTCQYANEDVSFDKLYCQLCEKQFETKLQMRNHGYRVHCKADNKCPYCLREFKRKHHLKDHVKTVHEGIRPYQCTYCDRSFGLSKTLRVHLMGHTNKRPFDCNICQKTFRQIAELNRHLKNHSSDIQFRCPICSQGKTSQKELDEHLTRHTNIEGYQCSKCGRKFTKLCHLKNHDDAVHLKLRPFKCEVVGCEKAFAARKTLQMHQQTHTGDGSNICDICNKEFSNRANLLRHSYMHKVTVKKECVA